MEPKIGQIRWVIVTYEQDKYDSRDQECFISRFNGKPYLEQFDGENWIPAPTIFQTQKL